MPTTNREAWIQLAYSGKKVGNVSCVEIANGARVFELLRSFKAIHVESLQGIDVNSLTVHRNLGVQALRPDHLVPDGSSYDDPLYVAHYGITFVPPFHIKVYLVQNMNAPGHVDLVEEKIIPEKREITPELFSAWMGRGFALKFEDEDGWHTVPGFRHIVADQSYALTRVGDSFSGFMKVEAEVQTKDCCNAIVRGDVSGLVQFKGGDINLEYNINPPGTVIRPSTNWQFPIRPDAVIMNGTEWCVIECKHKPVSQDISYFEEKIRFLSTNIGERWFVKQYTDRAPKKLIGVMCSVSTNLPKHSGSSLTFVTRQGLQYVSTR